MYPFWGFVLGKAVSMNVTRKKKRNLVALALRAGLVIVMLYLTAILIATQVDIVTKRQQLAHLSQQTAQQSAANLELRRTLESGDEDAYIERVAREKLGFALPDERVFVDMSGK